MYFIFKFKYKIHLNMQHINSSSETLINTLKNQIIPLGIINKDFRGIKSLIYGIIIMSIFEKISEIIPNLFNFFKNILLEYFKKKNLKLIDNISITPEKTSSIILERIFKNNDHNTDNDICDSILEYVSNINNVKYVKYKNMFLINNKEEIQIKDNIYIKLLNIIEDKNGGVENITIEIYSYKIQLQELRNFLENIKYEYTIKRKNKLGDQPYFFNEIIQPLRVDINKQLNYSAAPKHLKFSMTAFFSNKTLDNIYGENVKIIRNQFRFFINNKDWYSKKGIPYTFGLLLSGEPGTGKTSIIKAIANETRYHIINISLHESMTKTQLNNLFYQERIFIEKDGNIENYLIPLNKRIYIIEDIHCMTDIVIDREFKKNQNSKIIDKDDSEKLTLSYLLNLLDGVLEIPNRILIITSNYPERLDKALIRCGRIDLNIKFPYCNKNMILDIINNFYDINIEIKELDNIKENLYTPATVNQILFVNKNDYRKAIKDLEKEVDNQNMIIKEILSEEVKNKVNEKTDVNENLLEIQSFKVKELENQNIKEILSEEVKDKVNEVNNENLLEIQSLKVKELENINKKIYYKKAIEQIEKNILCKICNCATESDSDICYYCKKTTKTFKS